MTASALMSLGTQALFAAYRQVQTTSNNIANANTEGYSRQTVNLQTQRSENTGDGWIGRGVSVTTVSRASNAFLTQQANALTSATGADAARSDMLRQLEQVFGGTTSGLGNAATQVFNAFSDLGAAPSDLSARQAVLGRLDDFASLARTTAQSIAGLQTQLQDDVGNSVAEVNGLAKNVALLNTQIVDAQASGHQPNDLLDQRDQLIKQISEQVEVHTFTSVDGAMALFVASGESLVLGRDAHELVALPSADDPSRLSMGMKVDDKLTLLTREVTGEGRIAGLLRFQNDDLNVARNRLGQLVTAVAGSLNAQQSRGLDVSGQPGSPLYAIGPPQVVPAGDNARDAQGQFVSQVSITVVDPTALQASDYSLTPDPANAGNYIVTRLSDGQQHANVGSGDTVDGVRIDIGAPAPAVGERFTLSAVNHAADALTLVLRNPQGLAAANPVTASAATDNRGTLAVSGVDITAAPAAGYGPLTVRFNDDAGHYDILDGDGNALTSGSYSAGHPIAWDGMALTLSGLPRSGDRLLVAPTVHASSSNGNALTLQGMGERTLVAGQTAGDAFASLLSEVGVRTQSATAAATNSATALGNAKAQLTGETGVNLDEEAARLIQYQQSYQAAAKVLQTAQTMLDTVIQLGR